MNLKIIVKFFQENNYCHLENFNKFLAFNSNDELKFKNYWKKLVLDENFADYTHRERRILRYYYTYGQPLVLNRNSEYKSSVVYKIDYKQGGNQLTYVEDDFIQNLLLQQILAIDIKILENQLDKNRTYAIYIHLFRVKAQNGDISPTTSGIHQDGMDFICMHFIDANNAYPVVSKLYDNEEQESVILSKTMESFLETLIVNDRMLYHSANEVKQKIKSEVAWRDLLLVSFQVVEK